tara:strand:+ start:108 stop:938 length:831 start_codon:yes stop_codon:yes gene_type:complete
MEEKSFEKLVAEQIELAKKGVITFSDAGRLIRDYFNSGAWSPYRYTINQIKKRHGEDKDIFIYDYGCGSGRLIMALKCAGYYNSYGGDIVEKFDNRLFDNLGFGKNTFQLIKENKIPFTDEKFNLVTSNEVVEHVFDHDNYYSEASRVLKSGGLFIVHAPQRLQPYDTHSRCWFIHYFPRKIRIFLWDIFSNQGGRYLESYLNLKTINYQRKISLKYFSKMILLTEDKIRAKNFIVYKGNSILRNLASLLMDLPIIGKLFSSFFAILSSAEFHLIK